MAVNPPALQLAPPKTAAPERASQFEVVVKVTDENKHNISVLPHITLAPDR
jgi:hypothetical protein